MEAVYLQYWMRKWQLDENLSFRDEAIRQASWVREKIAGYLLKSKCFVVSTHNSKSCVLPVYYIKMRNGVKVIMRNNFFDWKVSVEIPSEYADLPSNYIPDDCLSYSVVENTTDKIANCYLEGFKPEWCYGSYKPKKPGKKFTIEVPDDEQLFCVLHALKHAYKDIVFKPSSDKRNLSEIKDAIQRILDENGYNDTECDKMYSGRVMSLFEIMWRTYSAMDKAYYNDAPNISRKEHNVCTEDVDVFANIVSRIDSVHSEFLMEEWMYNVEQFEKKK